MSVVEGVSVCGVARRRCIVRSEEERRRRAYLDRVYRRRRKYNEYRSIAHLAYCEYGSCIGIDFTCSSDIDLMKEYKYLITKLARRRDGVENIRLSMYVREGNHIHALFFGLSSADVSKICSLWPGRISVGSKDPERRIHYMFKKYFQRERKGYDIRLGISRELLKRFSLTVASAEKLSAALDKYYEPYRSFVGYGGASVNTYRPKREYCYRTKSGRYYMKHEYMVDFLYIAGFISKRGKQRFLKLSADIKGKKFVGFSPGGSYIYHPVSS